MLLRSAGVHRSCASVHPTVTALCGAAWEFWLAWQRRPTWLSSSQVLYALYKPYYAYTPTLIGGVWCFWANSTYSGAYTLFIRTLWTAHMHLRWHYSSKGQEF